MGRSRHTLKEIIIRGLELNSKYQVICNGLHQPSLSKSKRQELILRYKAIKKQFSNLKQDLKEILGTPIWSIQYKLDEDIYHGKLSGMSKEEVIDLLGLLANLNHKNLTIMDIQQEKTYLYDKPLKS